MDCGSHQAGGLKKSDILDSGIFSKNNDTLDQCSEHAGQYKKSSMCSGRKWFEGGGVHPKGLQSDKCNLNKQDNVRSTKNDREENEDNKSPCVCIEDSILEGISEQVGSGLTISDTCVNAPNFLVDWKNEPEPSVQQAQGFPQYDHHLPPKVLAKQKEIIATTWPNTTELANKEFPAFCDMYERIRQKALPIFLGAKIPVSSNLNIKRWEELLEGDSHFP